MAEGKPPADQFSTDAGNNCRNTGADSVSQDEVYRCGKIEQSNRGKGDDHTNRCTAALEDNRHDQAGEDAEQRLFTEINKKVRYCFIICKGFYGRTHSGQSKKENAESEQRQSFILIFGFQN